MGGSIAGLMQTRSGMAAGQLRAELDWLITTFKREGVRSYLEIGARSGDTFYEVVMSLPAGSRASAVDLPNGPWGFERTDKALRSCADDLRQAGYIIDLTFGDSHEKMVRAVVSAAGPFDAVLIDGDHTLKGAMQDWQDYGRLGRLVAFHDIAWKRDSFPGTRIEVPQLWQLLKQTHRTEEIITSPGDCGIGIVWNY